MRVAYVAIDPTVPVFGSQGSSVHIQETIRAFRKLGADVTLFTYTQDGYAPADLVDLEVRELERPEAKSQVEFEEALLTGNRSLMQMLERSGPFDLIYERYSVWGFGGMSYARSNDIRSILEVNDPLVELGAATKTLKDVGSARQIAKRAFADATVLVGVSKELGDYLRARTSEIGKVRVVPNGVNPDRFKPGLIPALPDRQGIFTVGFAGTLSLRQGLDTAVKAFAILHRKDPRARLLLVGNGPDKDLIARASASVGIAGAVELTGAVSPGIVPRLMASMDVGLSVYPRREQFYESPLKLLEYMAVGLPVIASSAGQPGEIVKNGQTGLTCPPGDFVSLSKALDKLRTDEQLRRRLGSAASEYVRTHHSWSGNLRSLLSAVGIDTDSGQKSFATVSA